MTRLSPENSPAAYESSPSFLHHEPTGRLFIAQEQIQPQLNTKRLQHLAVDCDPLSLEVASDRCAECGLDDVAKLLRYLSGARQGPHPYDDQGGKNRLTRYKEFAG